LLPAFPPAGCLPSTVSATACGFPAPGSCRRSNATEESRRLIERARAAIDDGRDHIVRSEETIAAAKKILALAKAH